VEGELRILQTDFAVFAFERFRQFTHVRWNPTDRPHTFVAFHRGDGATEGAVRFKKEPLDVFRHEPIFLALLHVGHEFAHVDIARAECLVVHVSPDARALLCVGVEINLRENLGHRPTTREPVLHQGIETGRRNDLANDVIHTVAAQRLAHVFELPEQPGHDLAFTGVPSHEIVNHRLLLLTVAMNTAHALLKAIWIPRNIVVHHERTELEVNALPRGFSGDHHRGGVFKELPLGIDTFLEWHTAVDRTTPEAQVRELVDEE